jgi:hypothetical protein
VQSLRLTKKLSSYVVSFLKDIEPVFGFAANRYGCSEVAASICFGARRAAFHQKIYD